MTLNQRDKEELFHELAQAARRKLQPATNALLEKVLTSLAQELWAVEGKRCPPCDPLIVPILGDCDHRLRMQLIEERGCYRDPDEDHQPNTSSEKIVVAS